MNSFQHPATVTGRAELLKFSYVALAIGAAELAPELVTLENILGENFEELTRNRRLRDGGSDFHATIVLPKEFRKLKKSASGGRIEIPSKEFALEITGIGTVLSEASQTWFAIARSEAVAAYRKRLELPAHDLHITLAFEAAGDVHGVPKDASTLLITTR